MSQQTHSQPHPPAEAQGDSPHGLKIGRELLRGRSPEGEVITFVCYDDGYSLRRDGHAVPGCRWDADQVEDALDAFRRLTRMTFARPAAPPAA